MIIQSIQGAHAISHLEIGKKLQNLKLKNQLQVLTKRESTKEPSTSVSANTIKKRNSGVDL